MCKILSVSASGYYSFSRKGLNPRLQENEKLDKKIQKIYQDHRGRYGMPRIHRELKAQGEPCGRHRVARRLTHLGLKAKVKRRFRVTTDSKHNLPIKPNLLSRDFTASMPNQKWVGDITYV